MLYPVEIISTAGTDSVNESNVQMHYVVYCTVYDEWKPCGDIVNFVRPTSKEFCLYKELVLQVKSSLVGQKRSNPAVKLR